MTSTENGILDICNDALIGIGSTPVNDVTNPTTPKEVTCSRMYSLVIGNLFTRHPWSFVNVQRQLQVDPDRPPDGNYAFAYRLPSNLLAGPFAVYADGELQQTVACFLVQGDYVHADYARVDIDYRAAPDPSIWPEYFRTLATVALMARLAKPIADNSDLQTELRIEAFGDENGEGVGGLFRDAKRLDAQTKPTKTIFQNGDPLTTARIGGLSAAYQMQRFKLP